MINTLADNGLFEFASMLELEESSSTKSKGQRLIILLEMVIDLGKHQSCQLSF